MKPVYLLPLLLALTSCANYVRTMGTKMISPEARGKLGSGSFEFRYQGAKRDRLDFSNNRADNAIEPMDTVHSLGMMAEVGLFSRLDVFIIPTIMSPPLFAAKFQVLGDPAKTAKEGNFSLSLYGGGGGRSEEGSADDLDIIDGNVTFDKVKVEVDHTEFGLISGYRWTDTFLNYLGVTYLREELNGKITKSSGSLNNEEFKYYHDGMIYSLGFIQHWSSSHLKLDYSHYISDWSRTRRDTTNTVNLAYGWHW